MDYESIYNQLVRKGKQATSNEPSLKDSNP